MQKAIYTTVGIDELLPHVQALKGAGARFVQMHAERCVDDGSYRLVYTFINVRAAQEQIARDGSYAIENLVVEGIDQYQEIPSISSYYPAVFPFENEAHDLFGLAITDMQILVQFDDSSIGTLVQLSHTANEHTTVVGTTITHHVPTR